MSTFWHDRWVVMVDLPLAILPNIYEGIPALNFLASCSHRKFINTNIRARIFPYCDMALQYFTLGCKIVKNCKNPWIEPCETKVVDIACGGQVVRISGLHGEGHSRFNYKDTEREGNKRSERKWSFHAVRTPVTGEKDTNDLFTFKKLTK